MTISCRSISARRRRLCNRTTTARQCAPIATSSSDAKSDAGTFGRVASSMAARRYDMRKLKWWVVLATLAASLFVVPGAYACGGFFCTNVPVDQAAERIIFAVNDDGTIDAYVQINYTGAPDAFAWVVPVPNPPKVDVATMAMLRELDLLKAPGYVPHQLRLAGHE